MIKISRFGFTLIEIMIGIMIISMVIIGGFQALTAVNIGKTKLMSSVDLEKQIIYFQEKLFEEIKAGGTIDYEEYFNRKVVGFGTSSGHYSDSTGFGNFGFGGTPGSTDYGSGFYQCRSGDTVILKMGTGGCLDSGYNNYSENILGNPQRYGQYTFQFIDYNSNYDSDGGIFGDEDGDGKIIGDDDDEYIGDGPIAFTGGVNVKELYLISGDKKRRTLFRWNVKKDPNAPSLSYCNIDSNNVITGTGCLGTIEFLKLDGKDYGLNHDLTGEGIYDGVVDTWIINDDFSSGNEVIAGTGGLDDFWVSLFPDTINVSDFQVYLYPNKDYDLAWKNNDDDVNLSPYVRLKLTVGPSFITKNKLKGNPKNIDFSTTISLTDIFSN